MRTMQPIFYGPEKLPGLEIEEDRLRWNNSSNRAIVH